MILKFISVLDVVNVGLNVCAKFPQAECIGSRYRVNKLFALSRGKTEIKKNLATMLRTVIKSLS